jgi:hypothetical protein
MSLDNEYDFYKAFAELEEEATAKVRKRAVLILLTRVFAVWLLWFYFVKPHLESRWLGLVVFFAYLQLLAYPGFLQRMKNRFSRRGRW